MTTRLVRVALGGGLAAIALTPNLPASAQCSDWLRQVALPKFGCSAQDIADICAGRRPVPTNGTCENVQRPVIDTSGPPYRQFVSLARASGMRLELHPTYTPAYFERRARLYCALLDAGEMVKLSSEISFPPVVNMTETTADRSRLEVAILRIGTAAYCPRRINEERQWEAANVR